MSIEDLINKYEQKITSHDQMHKKEILRQFAIEILDHLTKTETPIND